MAVRIFIAAADSVQPVEISLASRDRGCKAAVEVMDFADFAGLDAARIRAIAAELATIAGRQDLAEELR